MGPMEEAGQCPNKRRGSRTEQSLGAARPEGLPKDGKGGSRGSQGQVNNGVCQIPLGVSG